MDVSPKPLEVMEEKSCDSCENNPRRCHCLPGSQPNLLEVLYYSIPLQIVLEAETGGPMEEEAPNLEIFMQLKHQGV